MVSALIFEDYNLFEAAAFITAAEAFMAAFPFVSPVW